MSEKLKTPQDLNTLPEGLQIDTTTGVGANINKINDVPQRLQKKKNPLQKKTPAYDDGKYLGNLTSQEIRDYQAEKNKSKKTRTPKTKFKASGGRIHLKGGGICKKGINKKAFGKNS